MVTLFERKKNIVIHNLDEQDVTLCTDKILIQQAFYNLITNAIKYVEPQIGKIEFLVEQLPPTQIKIILRDNGKGIPLEIQEQVFDKFFQVKNQLIKKRRFWLGFSNYKKHYYATSRHYLSDK